MNAIPTLFSRKSEQPVILGGEPLGRTPLPFVRPQLPPLEELESPYREILSNGMVTTGPSAERLGEALRARLGVRHAVAVSSCTTGLLLAVQALNLPRGSVAILPSFTFMATALGAVWNGLRIRFVDVDRETMNIDPARVEEAVAADTSLIIGVHQFGAPAPVEALQRIADKQGIPLLFDAAHGFGSLRQGQPLGGNGRVEVFSLSPTKLLIAAEGGIVASNDEVIAGHVRIGRNYGNPGNYDCLFPGMNARMSELHAILALKSLERLEEAAVNRNRSANLYRELLRNVPGVSFQKIQENDRSSFKDFSIVVDERAFGLTRDQLARALAAEGIHTRVYYAPVLHKMEAFRPYAGENADAELPNTLYLESHALSLPMYSDMRDEEIERVAASLVRVQRHAAPIAALNLNA
ncbi:MAG: DegT/DnrJ/EryC1/StrS family aminotransferase [bacterium]